MKLPPSYRRVNQTRVLPLALTLHRGRLIQMHYTESKLGCCMPIPVNFPSGGPAGRLLWFLCRTSAGLHGPVDMSSSMSILMSTLDAQSLSSSREGLIYKSSFHPHLLYRLLLGKSSRVDNPLDTFSILSLVSRSICGSWYDTPHRTIPE